MTQQEKEIRQTTLGELSYNGTQVVRQGESTIPAFERTCFKCGTEFIYISEAIKHDRDGDYVICPTCGAFIVHQERPKTADFIPPKSTTDAKSEDRSPKHSDSFTSLEEAAENYAEKHGFRVPYDGSEKFYDETDVKASKDGFIAGAKWQKSKMLKEAVEGLICATITGTDAISFLSPLPKELTAGDKVKIVIIKED